jgi:hypothetical protein
MSGPHSPPVEPNPDVRMEPVRARGRRRELVTSALARLGRSLSERRDSIGIVAERQAVPVHAGVHGKSIMDSRGQDFAGLEPDGFSGEDATVAPGGHQGAPQVYGRHGGIQRDRVNRAGIAASLGGLYLVAIRGYTRWPGWLDGAGREQSGTGRGQSDPRHSSARDLQRVRQRAASPGTGWPTVSNQPGWRSHVDAARAVAARPWRCLRQP